MTMWTRPRCSSSSNSLSWLALKEGRLLVELERDRTEAVRITRHTWASLSSVEQAAIHWFLVPVWVFGQLLLITLLRFSLSWFAGRC